jgi:diguanylate cyclase (GGDEF)-like protein
VALPPKVRITIAAATASGLATLALATGLARRGGFGPGYELAPLTVLLAFSWAFPLLVLRNEDTEAFHLDEGFFVAMALLLPVLGTLVVFAAASALGQCIRRRPMARFLFNSGQIVTATGLGLAVTHALAPIHPGHVSPRVLGAAAAGAAVFMVVSAVAVSLIISFNEGKSVVHELTNGIQVRLMVWSGGLAIGLLAGIGGAAEPSALAIGAIPLAALNLVLREYSQARRQMQRSQGLLLAAAEVHASVALGDVELAVARATKSLLACRHARIDVVPPSEGEFGVPLPETITPRRWLVVANPIGFEPFGRRERELLEGVAGIAAGALENACLVEEIRHRAIHDSLTELPNKALFVDRLEHALAQAPRLHRRLAVLFMDVDHFKVVNDSLGHDAGDAVLLGVADRLKTTLRSGDTVARLGGDEFAVLCEPVDDLEDAVELAERIRACVSGSLVANGVELSVTASVGLVLVESGWDVAPETLLQAADTAMYRAKERGRDRIEVFDDGLRSRAVARLEKETTLRRAVEEGRLRVFYQPIIDVASGRIVEVEALLRIETSSGTLLSPADFIEVAEGSGLIATIGLGVLEQACHQAVLWRDRFGAAAPRRVAVNLSTRQVNRVAVADMVQRVLASTGCAPEMLALEITETALMEAGAQIRDELGALRDVGVSIGLDDFGTGYSSLAYLKRFPLDFLKIDRCFVAGLGQNPEDDAIVDAVIGLGRSLGLTAVAEGVESQDQLDRLRALGCHRVQGYLLGRPQPADALNSVLARQTPVLVVGPAGLVAGPAGLAVGPAGLSPGPLRSPRPAEEIRLN